jgi:hypothetical protein
VEYRAEPCNQVIQSPRRDAILRARRCVLHDPKGIKPLAHYPPHNTKRVATCITRQDGACLAQLLMGKGYEVYGSKRRSGPCRPIVQITPFAPGTASAARRDLQPGHAMPHAGDRQSDGVRRLSRRRRRVASAGGPATAGADYERWRPLQSDTSTLLNHESRISGETFVASKITRAMARIALGLQDCLYLGNILGNMDALRDWGLVLDDLLAVTVPASDWEAHR